MQNKTDGQKSAGRERDNMVECKNNNGFYTLVGLKIEDLELIQEGIHRLFNESIKEEHHEFRSQVLRIDRAIDPELEKHFFINQEIKHNYKIS